MDDEDVGGGGSEEPEEAYTNDRVGLDALRVDDEVRSWKGGLRPGVGAGEGAGFEEDGAMSVRLCYAVNRCYLVCAMAIMNEKQIAPL